MKTPQNTKILLGLTRISRPYYVILLTLTSAIDLLGIFLAFKMISVAVDNDTSKINQNISHFNDLLGIPLSMPIYLIGLVVVLVLSCCSRIYNTYLVNSIPNYSRADLTEFLITRNMKMEYRDYCSVNLDHEIKDIITELDLLVERLIMSYFSIINFSAQFVIIIAFLFYTDPIIAVTCFLVYGFAYLMIGSFTRHRLSQISIIRNSAVHQRTQFVIDSLRNRKILQIYNLTDKFIRSINLESSKIATANISFAVLSFSPKFIIETLTLIAFTIFLFVSYPNEQAASMSPSMLPSIGLFLVASYRLLPVLQGFYQNISSINYTKPILQRVLDKTQSNSHEKSLPSPLINQPEPDKSNWELSLTSVSVELGGTEILNRVSLQISPGTRLAICGESGSGKSTLIDTIAGLLKPTTGQVRYARDILPRIALVSQSALFLDGTIEDNITLNRSNNCRKWLVTKILQLGLAETIGEANAFLKRPVIPSNSGLSGGQAQRIMFLRAIYGDPDLLILDEATSALDGTNANRLLNIIEELTNTAVVFVSHDPSILGKFKNSITLQNGRVNVDS